MIVMDASVWVSHLVAGDIHHAISRRWLIRVVREGIVVAAPALLLAEVAGAIARRTSDPGLGHQAIEHVMSTPDLRLVHTDTTLGMAAARLAADERIRGADAFYIAVAQQLNIPLISWDQEQIDRAAKVIQAFSPE